VERRAERAPLRRIQTRVDTGTPSPAYRCLSGGSLLFRVLISNRLVGALGSPLPPRSRRFRRRKRSLPATVPRLLAHSGSSSRELAAPSESFRPVPAPRLPAWSTFRGVAIPLRGVNQRRRCGGRPRPTTLRPRRFSRPRRFDPPPALRVYFTPQPRPGFALQGVPRSHSRAASSASRALSSVGDDPLPMLPPAPRNHRPALRALIHARVRC